MIAPSPPTRERHYDILRMVIDMWLTPKLISECTTSSSFSANREDNDQGNENHPDNENEGDHRANKYMFKVNNRKKKLQCLYDKLWTYFTPCSSVCNDDFECVIVHRAVFSTTTIKGFMFFCIKNLIFLLSFLNNGCFLKIFFPRFSSHFRLVQMTLKSITFGQNH